jgi:hypothetical protein
MKYIITIAIILTSFNLHAQWGQDSNATTGSFYKLKAYNLRSGSTANVGADTAGNLILFSSSTTGLNHVYSSTGLANVNDSTLRLDTAYTDARYLPDGLIQPGYVSWSGTGLTFDVTSAIYTINAVRYTSAAGSVTLATADPTDPRYDVIAVDNTGTVVKITGTAGVNPTIPQTDPATQVYLTAIYVAAGATTPGDITQTLIYDENSEAYSGTSVGVSSNFNNTTSPYHLTKSADIGSWTAGQTVTFTKNTGTALATDYTVLKAYILLKAALSSTANIRVSFLNGTTVVSNVITLAAAQGFTKSNHSSFQNITIPISAFTFSSTTFNKIRFTLAGTGGGMYLDYVQFQGGIVTTIPAEVDPFSVHVVDSAAMLSPYLRKIDTTGKWVNWIYRKTASDSVFYVKNGTASFAYKDSTGGGGSSALSSLTAATATNDINSTTFKQTWRWNSLAGDTAFVLNSSTTAAASNAQVQFASLLSGVNGTTTQRTISGVFRNIHTGTLANNVGLWVTAARGTSNYAIIVDTGFVGIGTTAPPNTLSVLSTTNADGVSIDGTTNPAYTLRVSNTAKGYLAAVTGSTAFFTNAVANDIAIRCESGRVLLGSVGGTAAITANNSTVGIFTITPAYPLDVTGKMRATDSIFANKGIVVDNGTNPVIQMKIGGVTKAYAPVVGTAANQFFLGTASGDLIFRSESNNIFLGRDNGSGTATPGLSVVNNIIGINQTSPAASSILDIVSTTKGVLLPRMTKTQRDAISSPATGLMIYQTDNTPGLRVYNGTNWMRYTETAD